MNHSQIKKFAKDSIQMQAEAVNHLNQYINEDFEAVVKLILKSKGRVVITGIGKSAIIAQKIVATMNSTGTPAVFMHAADAIHGDLGTILKDDIVICISKSGNTPEIKVLVPLIKNFENKLIALTGNQKSYLAEHSDFTLLTPVKKEACPNNLAPTTSTTAQLVMGDALAVTLLKMKGFSKKDFAKYHPGGALGKALYLRVSDITKQNLKPQVHPENLMKEVIIEISKNMLGVTPVIENEKIIGIITDGDLRRMLTSHDDIKGLKAKDIMTEHPKTINNKAMAVDALEILENNSITQIIAEEDGKYKGIVHLHNLIREGII
ncbi:KpsF/GutQ family sugar-phosphate isomerase [Mesohalobacter halotolerans]|uniref:KpsF/GutQ family sugar-phosphate isomerase n=1 Tax=Mesohalobacter halotolerans TaxID=1883405 RepID=A0A4U5TQX0_9FLAO|nr:KpsF/GutQ family sugar-phosphate isomerase [Mesohalobacter halotolerans]MBS3738820.1 KpsF/GutQ family sugar-phosphate isomerase [Psychroflexus sp.]TKS56466.1 KpsF/GutQ family sugar-phosphate isomerase [Mesohalobacter halotolerans]